MAVGVNRTGTADRHPVFPAGRPGSVSNTRTKVAGYVMKIKMLFAGGARTLPKASGRELGSALESLLVGPHDSPVCFATLGTDTLGLKAPFSVLGPASFAPPDRVRRRAVLAAVGQWASDAHRSRSRSRMSSAEQSI
jgi:hypothetical protein